MGLPTMPERRAVRPGFSSNALARASSPSSSGVSFSSIGGSSIDYWMANGRGSGKASLVGGLPVTSRVVKLGLAHYGKTAQYRHPDFRVGQTDLDCRPTLRFLAMQWTRGDYVLTDDPSQLDL